MNPKLYKLTILVENQKRVIEVISNSEDFNEKRIEKQLFDKGKPKPYKILKHEIIKDKLGLV